MSKIDIKFIRRISVPLLILVFSLSIGFGQIPPGYYNSAIGKSGETLQIALYNIIKGHNSVSYTPGVWNAFYTTDLKPNDSIWDMYSDIPGGTPPYEYTPGTEQCGNSSGEGDCYSREHSFPQSWFLEAMPMKTDLFQVYPVDQYVNNMHSDNPYGTVASPTWTSLNGSKKGPCSAPGYTGTVFEPRDEYKGDFARSYFYMATRYENLIAGWVANGSSSEVLDGTSYPAYKSWFLNLMIIWHNQDPVSAKEIARNEAVYLIQDNRNPYIDHPEYVAAVWTPSGPKAEPTNHVTAFIAVAGTPSYSAITLNWTDATGAVVPDGYLVRGSSVSLAAIPSPADGTPVPDGGLDKNIAPGSQACTFTGLSASTTYYFKIFPFTNSGTLINYKTDGTVPSASRTTAAGPKAEPTNHVTGFAADTAAPSYSAIKDIWTDAMGSVVPDGYLVRGSNVSLMAITSPVDGTPVADGGLDKNVAAGIQTWTFTGLSASTPYYFKIFPFTNSGTAINYKTDGTVPSASATTTAGISALQPGDIAIIEVNSTDPDRLSFVTLKQLNAGTTIRFTDNGYSSPSAAAITNEGYLNYTTPSVIPAGTVVSWYSGMLLTGTGWSLGTPSVQFATAGDQVFAYQGTWAVNQTLIYGVQVGSTNGWITTGSPTSNTSYLPSVLTSNETALTFPDKNVNYNLITSGTTNALSSLIAYPGNWTRSTTNLPTPGWNFIIDSGTLINQDATVQSLIVGSNESLTIQSGKKLTVLGTLDISGGN